MESVENKINSSKAVKLIHQTQPIKSSKLKMLSKEEEKQTLLKNTHIQTSD